MKHILVNKDGQVHATIVACPFKYTVPRSMTVYEDNPVSGKIKIDHYTFDQPKPHDDVQAHAMDFALIKEGLVQSVVVWGGAEWCPPAGVMMIPVEKWMGTGDHYDGNSDKWDIHENRLGKSDKNKTVQELQADADAIQLS